LPRALRRLAITPAGGARPRAPATVACARFPRRSP
jgi:hypothetical protein